MTPLLSSTPQKDIGAGPLRSPGLVLVVGPETPTLRSPFVTSHLTRLAPSRWGSLGSSNSMEGTKQPVRESSGRPRKMGLASTEGSSICMGRRGSATETYGLSPQLLWGPYVLGGVTPTTLRIITTSTTRETLLRHPGFPRRPRKCHLSFQVGTGSKVKKSSLTLGSCTLGNITIVVLLHRQSGKREGTKEKITLYASRDPGAKG